MREAYDFVIVGGGLSGLSLAWRLAHEPGTPRTLLLVDRDPLDDQHRTFSWGARRPTVFDHLAAHQWDRIRIRSAAADAVVPLGPYRYRTVRGADLQYRLRPALAARPGVDLVEGDVREVEDGERSAVVRFGPHAVTGGWVFDSRPAASDFRRGRDGAVLRQRFKGWEVETERDAFDPDLPLFFDFGTPQRGAARFFYLLPFSPRRALVEYVVYGPDAPDDDLRAYLEERLGVREYRVVFAEQGVSPLAVRRPERRRGRRVLGIGVHGGRLKASTGYAYVRIQDDTAAIAASLRDLGHPFRLPRDPWLYRFLDRFMLRVMARHGDRVGDIFGGMFARNPVERVFRFLDEEAGWLDAVRLGWTLPKSVFVRTLLRWMTGRRP